MADRVSRRALLGTGGMLLASPAMAITLPLTPSNEVGPFYRRNAPDDPVLRRPGDPGLPLELSGRVLDPDGQPIGGARVEVWQADHAGHYDVAGNRFRATLVSGADGVYRVSTVMPGHYPGRVCQHIHFIVHADGRDTLVTQLYFASDPVFEGDPAANFRRDPRIGDAALVRPVELKESGASSVALCRFDLVV